MVTLENIAPIVEKAKRKVAEDGCRLISHKELEAGDVLDLANAEEYNYRAGENVVRKCPLNKVVYTAMDGDEGQVLEVGARFVDRFAVYFGDDIGFPQGTIFEFEPLEDCRS